MTVSSILKAKGNAVHTALRSQSLAETAKSLSEQKVGAAVVLSESGAVAGILSERDIVAAIAAHGSNALQQSVADFMTRDIVTCRRADTVEYLMGQMTDRRIRHIPVVEGGELLGLVSIGDLVKERIASAEMEAHAMRDYIAAR